MDKRRSGMQKRIPYENKLDTRDCRVLCETSCERAPFRTVMFVFAPVDCGN